LANSIKYFVGTYKTNCILFVSVCIQVVKIWKKVPLNQAVCLGADWVCLFLIVAVAVARGICIMVRLRQRGVRRQTAKADGKSGAGRKALPKKTLQCSPTWCKIKTLCMRAR